jgi:hypothetical protein
MGIFVMPVLIRFVQVFMWVGEMDVTPSSQLPEKIIQAEEQKRPARDAREPVAYASVQCRSKPRDEES